MAARSKAAIREREIVGLKFFRRLRPLLARLHNDACARDRAGNRRLFFDEYCLLILLFLFNPAITSLRSLSRASEFQRVRRRLGCRRTSLGSLSEAARVFDADLLKEIVEELLAQAPSLSADARLQQLEHALTIVDGTLLRGLPRLVEAAYTTQRDGRGCFAWRIHTHFDARLQLPTRFEITAARNAGPSAERAVLRRFLAPDHCYVLDRGYVDYGLFNAIHAMGSSYVCRLRSGLAVEILADHPLSPEAAAASVLADQQVRLGSGASVTNHAVRMVTLEVAPHVKRQRRSGRIEQRDRLQIVTNLVDVPAEVVALIYRHRWLIELFFRFFKHLLGCAHLLSHAANGIAIQVYCAILACLLMTLYTGRHPNKVTLETVCLYLQGWVSDEELDAHLLQLKPARP